MQQVSFQGIHIVRDATLSTNAGRIIATFSEKGRDFSLDMPIVLALIVGWCYSLAIFGCCLKNDLGSRVAIKVVAVVAIEFKDSCGGVVCVVQGFFVLVVVAWEIAAVRTIWQGRR